MTHDKFRLKLEKEHRRCAYICGGRKKLVALTFQIPRCIFQFVQFMYSRSDHAKPTRCGNVLRRPKSESPGVNFLLDKHHNSRRQICRRNSRIPPRNTETSASASRPLHGKYLRVLSKQYHIRSRGSNKNRRALPRPGAAPVKLEKQSGRVSLVSGTKRKELVTRCKRDH